MSESLIAPKIADSKDADVTLALRNFRVGDNVKTVILSVDHKAHRISLGLKPSYFVDEDLHGGSEDDVEMIDAVSDGQVDDDANAHYATRSGKSVSTDHESDITDQDLSDDDEDVVIDPTSLDLQFKVAQSSSSQAEHSAPGPVLSLQGFQWADGPTPDAESVLSSDEEDSHEKGSKRRKKKIIEMDLTADMHSKLPESVADFERLLLASPNSSYMWIQFMAFQLQLAEIEKAREIAKRALSAINIREEQERLNVWIALLNLENTYGTEESLDQTFKEAARHNDTKTVYLRFAAILDQSDKPEVCVGPRSSGNYQLIRCIES